MAQIYVLPLNDNGSPQVAGEYIYIAPKTRDPVTVRFTIEGTSSICRYGSLWVNIPLPGKEFRRDSFREFKLVPDFNRTIEIDVSITQPGAFAFYATYAELPPLTLDLTSSPPSPKKQTPLYYIDVAPRLEIGGKPLPLPALSVFSTISKFMGRYPDDWERHLSGVSGRGYNMVHFTPLQIRGASDSPYSLYDQLGWDPACFPGGEADVQAMVDSLEKKHGLLSMTDIVLNHTAHNTAWLRQHPEAGYNLSTAPWLESAYLLDTELLDLGTRLGELGLPTELKTVDDLPPIIDAVKKEVINKIRLWEFYALDVARDADAAVDSWSMGDVSEGGAAGTDSLRSASLKAQAVFLRDHGLLGNDRLGERFRRRIDSRVAAELLSTLFGKYNDGSREAARSKMVEILDAANLPLYKEYDAEVAVILRQLSDRIKYVRLDEHGPKLGAIDAKNPLIESYFTRLAADETHTAGDLVLANNGWVWAGDALVDNAGPGSRAYLRRELIVWGDCVKLRYGGGPEDSPWLWAHMTAYARLLARYFAGFRIDNCHSTPLHVAEHVLDEARRVRPDLYVVAELFTGDEKTDYVFVRRLGLGALVREAMQAWSPAELSRLVHRHGGRPIGSFGADGGSTRLILPVPVQALFMDCTHDNEVPAQKRDARDTLPNAALVSMCASASGSVMGYDEIYPKLVDLVHETRLYSFGSGGISDVKKTLNHIHVLMGRDGYDETHIHHEDQYVTVHRVHPGSRKGYFLIAHTAFPGFGDATPPLSPVRLAGTRAKSVGSWKLEVDDGEKARRDVLGDKKCLRGLPSRVVDIQGAVGLEGKKDETVITIDSDFPPGSIALFETWTPAAEHSAGLDEFATSGAPEAMRGLDLVDLNFVLYRCDAEEHDWSGGRDGVYDVPGYGKLVYAGLQGLWSVMRDIIRDNDLGHPLCQNLRDGRWALDYTVGRLERATEEYSRLAEPAAWLRERFDAIRILPASLQPRYFGLVLRAAYTAAWERGVSLMDGRVKDGQWFLQSLAMVSVQQTGVVRSASLHPGRNFEPSLAAGLPHFAVEWARCWGRDVFISMRGLLLGTGRFAEAREHIVAFASVLKHGMIPNLLSSGDRPRYNARDAVWFFLQAVQDYERLAPADTPSILDAKVRRRFLPYDDVWFAADDPRAFSRESTVADIVQEALQRHAEGIRFREAHAGPEIDSQMTDAGFDQYVHVDWDSGLVFGGNQHNCGTWMDKMGSSAKAGNKGVPGTPRDGCAVEIAGLLYSALRWVANLHAAGRFAHDGVARSDGSRISYVDWADLVRANFERCFYVPEETTSGEFDINPTIVARRGIYKDLYRSGKEYEDYQLRPNFAVAMAVAPDLFTPQRALAALLVADKVLRGPTGMATLDPADAANYRPYYHNSDDSADFQTAAGRNYHQGPEWLWPTGFFLRALLKFDLARRRAATSAETAAAGCTEAFQQVTQRLAGCKAMMEQSPWAGLTELTNKGGESCADSSPTQAWSAGCLIDLYMDAAEEQSAKQLPLR